MTETLLEPQALNALHPLPGTGAAADVSKPDSPAAQQNEPPRTAQELWQQEKKPWASTARGRIAMRAVSRGIIGSVFYTWGTQKIIKDMKGYSGEIKPQNFLQHVARMYDNVAGKPIEFVLNKIGKEGTGTSFVSFRPTLETPRTLGEEVIYNIFDFAMASAGDAMGREMIGMFDPATEKKWRGADGKIKFPQAARSLAGASGRVFMAQAEDWFAAVPYTFQQKFQRNLIDKFSPGFKYTSDSTLHGSCYKLDDQGNVRGTYALEGMIDLQGRFTGYNFYTGLFRDITGAVKRTVTNYREEKNDGTKKPHNSPTPETMFRAGKTSARNITHYLLNRLIKTAVVMTPSVPVFSALRVPQNRDVGIGITPDGRQRELQITPKGRAKATRITSKDQEKALWHAPNFDVKAIDRSGWKTADRLVYGALDPLGGAANRLSHGAGNIAQHFAKSEAGKDRAKFLARHYVNGSMAYTPYIYAKNEFARLWDNRTMDDAVNRFVDGIFNAKGGEIKEGALDIAHAIRHRKGRTEEKTEDAPGFVERLGREKTTASWQEQVAAPANAGPVSMR